jgi:hypothetical protein
VAPLDIGGIGVPWPEPPVPGCFPVFIASDSQGKFGFQCGRCQGYWRAGGGASVCAYCGHRDERHHFLSSSQRYYVQLYCEALSNALHNGADGDHVIDMDAVADAAGKDVEKPKFYYAEESQQKQFNCAVCGEFNDVLGRFAYCSTCGTRNDLEELENAILPPIRARANSGGPLDSCLKDIASAFDTFVSQYTRQLINNGPMRSARREKISKMRFHNLTTTRSELMGGFDIDVCEGIKTSEIDFATRMFHRRHVYEHNGGEVDVKYIAESGDTSVRVKQMIRETQASIHDFATLVLRMARNLHRGFHDICPPIRKPIELHEAQQQRMKAYTSSGV